jgi:DNA-binding CsgD family transcriptional regulator
MKIIENMSLLSYFKKASEPLKDDLLLLKTYLGISEFGYMKMFFDNNFFYLSSDPKMVDDLLQHIDNATIFFEQTLAFNHGYCSILWPELPTHPTMELYIKNDHWNGISFLKKNKDSIEMHWFTSELSNASAKDFYTKNHKLLIAFIQHWLYKNTKRLDLNAPKMLANFANGVDFSNLDAIECARTSEDNRVQKFLELIRLDGVNINTKTCNAHITSRGLECFRLLANGYTSKEAANLLKISSSTVECHTNNIRSKLGSLYKSYLIKLYRQEIIDCDS